MDCMAIAVAEYLNFNMARLLQETLHVDGIIAKPHFSITLRCLN